MAWISDAKSARAVSKRTRGSVGANHPGKVDVAQLFSERPALRLLELSQDNRPARILHGTCAARAERPSSNGIGTVARRTRKNRQDQIVSSFVGLKRRSMILGKVFDLHDKPRGSLCDGRIIGVASTSGPGHAPRRRESSVEEEFSRSCSELIIKLAPITPHVGRLQKRSNRSKTDKASLQAG